MNPSRPRALAAAGPGRRWPHRTRADPDPRRGVGQHHGPEGRRDRAQGRAAPHRGRADPHRGAGRDHRGDPPDRPRAPPRPPRAVAVARGEHGPRRQGRLRAPARDRRRRLPRPDARPVAGAGGRLLAPCYHRAARGDQLRGARADPGRSCAASTSRRSARSPPRSGRCGLRSRTRARASATRARSSGARWARGHEHEHAGGATAPSPQGPRPGHRLRRASRACPWPAPTSASTRSSSTTTAATRWRRPGSHEAALRGLSKGEAAGEVGKLLAERAKGAGVSRVVFDRGGYKYHGRVKSLADGAREGGLEF